MKRYEELYTEDFQNKLKEIQILLTEAYTSALKDPDTTYKSSEGWIQITLPPFFWTGHTDKRPEISIYSYVLGPHRTHNFNDIDQALVAVKEWHQMEMQGVDPCDRTYTKESGLIE